MSPKIPTTNYVYESGEIDFFQLMEDRRLETEGHIVKLHEKVDKVKDDIYEEIEKSHSEIMNEIREMKQEQKIHHEHECNMMSSLDRRIESIEKWKWLIVGGGTTIAFLVIGGLDGIKALLS